MAKKTYVIRQQLNYPFTVSKGYMISSSCTALRASEHMQMFYKFLGKQVIHTKAIKLHLLGGK